jgi:Raf kinase inhibitor-like YbhB/YbcL family protein
MLSSGGQEHLLQNTRKGKRVDVSPVLVYYLARKEVHMKTTVLWVGIPLLLIVGGIAILLWRTVSRQQAEASYHAGLARSVQIGSDAFEDNGDIPIEFSCKGEGISPPLRWSSVPEDTRSLVLLVTDDELPTPRLGLFKIVHWVLYNIPRDVAELPANATEADISELGIVAGRNWSRETNFYPPCPLYGRHRYVFRIYALDTDTIQPETNDRQGILKAMQGHVLAYGELSGFYAR